MCGRFTLKTPVADWLADLFPELSSSILSITEALNIQAPETLEPRFNIAPSQQIVVVYQSSSHPVPTVQAMRWGLVPFWAATPDAGYKMINARSETLFEKTTFKRLIPEHRCIVLADGYYEWQSPLLSGNSKKQPYWIHAVHEKPFAIAGLWSENRKIVLGRICQSVTIITTAANTDTEPVHDRMPVILEDDSAIRSWLKPTTSEQNLRNLIRPASSGYLSMHPVSTLVNSPRHDGAELIAGL